MLPWSKVNSTIKLLTKGAHNTKPNPLKDTNNKSELTKVLDYIYVFR